MEKDYADATIEEQVKMIEQTNNSLKLEDTKIKQPKQDPDYRPDPDDVIEAI